MADFTFAIFIIVIIFLIVAMFLQRSTPVSSAKKLFDHRGIDKIDDGLYLSNFADSKKYEVLKALGIRQIMTIGQELPRHGEPWFKVMHVKISDVPDENIEKYFNPTFSFIKKAPTLVHCAAGISRSVTIIAAYLMRKYEMTVEEAVAHIKKCRPIANPNPGFIKQLEKFESLHKIKEAHAENNADASAKKIKVDGEN